MDIYFESLQFEITRRCNDNCIHCCRGEAQELDLEIQVIDSFFDNNKIMYIHRLLLSGGEPTLGAASFEYLVNKIIEKKVEVHIFEFSINGHNYDERFVEVLKKLNGYCLNFRNKESQISGIFWVSEDQFHRAPSQEVLDKYMELPFFAPYRGVRHQMEEQDILPVGRALENNLSPHKLDIDMVMSRGIDYKKKDVEDKECLYIPYLYVSSNGNIQNSYGSMYSYDIMDTYYFGNCKNQNLEEIVLNNPVQIKKR